MFSHVGLFDVLNFESFVIFRLLFCSFVWQEEYYESESFMKKWFHCGSKIIRPMVILSGVTEIGNGFAKFPFVCLVICCVYFALPDDTG